MLDRGCTELGRITKSGILRSQGLWPPSALQPGMMHKRRKVVPSGQP